MTTPTASSRPRRHRAGIGQIFPALLLLAGCAVERNPLDTYTYTGQNLGAVAFKEIPVADSKVSFTGADPTKRREAQSLSDRYSERITFKNNATMRYDKITISAGFSSAWSDADDIEADVENSIFYKDRAIVFDRSKIKSGGYYTYLLQTSPTHNCFVFHGMFGDTQKGRAGSPGDQSISGGMCYLSSAKSLDALEREMTDILARARYDDGAGNRALPPAQTAAATPVQASVAKPLATPADLSAIVPCYSQRLDVLYRARACLPTDKTVDTAELDRIRGRLAHQRGATAPSDGVPFAPAPTGTVIYSGVAGYIEIVAADDMLVTTINAAGEISHRFGLFEPLPVEAQFDARAAERIWPLVVGRETSFIRSRDSSSWQDTIKVVRTERLTIPAGTFDTYVVERHTLGMGSNDFDGTSTYWYAPTVGDIVRYDVKIRSGTTNAGNKPWEATRIVRPDAT